MSSGPLPIPPLDSPNTPSPAPASDSISTSCNSSSSVPFVELSFNTPYYRTYTPGKGYSGNIAMPAADKCDDCSDDDVDDGEGCEDDVDEGSGDEDEDEDDEHEGSEDDDDDEVKTKGKNGNENAWKAGTARNLWLPHNTRFGETKVAAERQPEDDIRAKTDGADQVEKSAKVTSSCAYMNKHDDQSKIAKNSDAAYGVAEESNAELLNSQSSFARLSVDIETEDVGDVPRNGIEDFADSSILYDWEPNAGESLEGALPTTDTGDLRELFGEDVEDDIQSSSNPPTGTAAAAERAIGVQEIQTTPTLAELKNELSEIVFKKVDASAAERRVLEKQRTELVRKITSMQRKLAREKDDAMKVNKTGNLRMPPPDKPDPWSLIPAARSPVGHLTSGKSQSQKRKAEEALDDTMLDTEVLPSIRKRKGRKLNKIEQAMEMAGLYPEDPDREEREQQTKEERSKEREREKRQRALEREENKARKEKERIAKGRESGKGKKKSLWDKWSARMPWETGRWTTQYEKSG